MSDIRGNEEVRSLTGRLTDRFPGIPATSIHDVAAAAWAEVANNPVREVAPELAEQAATESLIHYPLPPAVTESPVDPVADPDSAESGVR